MLKIKWDKKTDTVSHAEYIITVPMFVIHEQLDEMVKSILPHVKVNGFRKGKAPKKAVINTLGEDKILNDLKQRIQNQAFEKLIQCIKSKPVGPPSFSDAELRLDSDYVFEVDFAKEINKLNPTHDHHLPVVGDLSGGPMEVYAKLYNDKISKTDVSEHLPEELSQSMPDKIIAHASTNLSDLKNPLKISERKKPQPNRTDTVDELTKTTQPSDLILDEPYKKLDDKTKPPGVELDEKLPDTKKKPEFDIKEPEIDDSKQASELAHKIETPSNLESVTPEHKLDDIDSDKF